MLAATLVSGASVFTSCSNDNSDNSGSMEQAKRDRQEFIQHTRQNLKTLAENMNFSTWKSVNYFNTYLNQYVLLNDNFDKTFSRTVGMEVQKSLKPLPAEVAAQTGKKYIAEVNLADFDYIFKSTEKGFDVTPNSEDGMLMEFASPKDPNRGTQIHVKGSGEEYVQPSQALSNDSVAVVVRFPAHYDFTLSKKENGAWVSHIMASFDVAIAHGDYDLKDLPADATDITKDTWNLKGVVSTTIPGDATAMVFNIGQNPGTHKAGMTFDYTHNGVKTVGLRAVLTNDDGVTDFSKLDLSSSSNILSVITAVMVGKSIDELTLTLLDDLTTTVKVADCQKVMQLQTEMAAARRNYADRKTIDGYTQQLNGLVSAEITCKGIKQQIPMRLVTSKFGPFLMVLRWMMAPHGKSATPMPRGSLSSASEPTSAMLAIPHTEKSMP